jgi:hypothetical protein
LQEKNLVEQSRILFENLIIAQRVKKLLIFMELEGSLPCSQEPVFDPYPELDELSTHTQNLHLVRSILIPPFFA